MINLKSTDVFADRHIGPDEHETKEMLLSIGADSVDALIAQTVPASIRRATVLTLPEAQSEFTYLNELRKKAKMPKASMDQLFVHFVGPSESGEQGGLANVKKSRRIAQRLG